MSLAAGIVARAAGDREHGPARVQAAHAQQAQAGADAHALRGAPVKKEAKPHRRRASLQGWHGRSGQLYAMLLGMRLTLACKQGLSERHTSPCEMKEAR